MSSADTRSGHLVAIVVPPEFTLVPLGVAIESFAYPRARHMSEWYDVRLSGARPGVEHAVGGRLSATITDGVETIAAADTVIVPQAVAGVRAAVPEVIDALREAHENGARMVSFGSGAFALAAAGVLDGRRVTTHWRHARALARAFPRVRVDPGVLYIDDGQVLTSAGRVASIDLVLHIIRKDHGVHAANAIARDVVAYPHRDGAQAQVISTPVLAQDDERAGIRRSVRFALEHLDEELGLAEMSALAFMSPRHFSRRFRETTGTTPVKWLNQQRLARACELLEETRLPIERIAQQAGFRSSVTFRQRFAQQYLTSPAAYRRAFHAQGLPEPAALAETCTAVRCAG